MLLILATCVSKGYTPHMKEKDAGMRIRVERELRDEFLKVCREQDRPAAQVIREFMRRYIAVKKTGSVGQVEIAGETPVAPRAGK